MRKFLLGITLVLGVALSGCVFDDKQGDYITEAEMQAMIDDAIQEAQLGQLSDLSDSELRELILELFPEDEVISAYNIEAFEESITSMIKEKSSGILGVSVDVEVDGVTSTGTGSGVIYKKELSASNFVYDYYLVTNNHVVEDASEITLIYEENDILFQIPNEYITLLGTDPQTDLAVLKFSSSEEFEVIEFADSYQIDLGDFVFAIGNPLGFQYYGTVTMGIISGLTRFYQEQGVEDGFDATVLQHDAEINPGNSGGALLDIHGDLVGINFMKIVRDDVDGIGFAIPSNTVKRIAEDLEDDGIVSKPYLGISTRTYVNDCNMDYGVCLSEVTAGLPADLAGLEVGDVIIGFLNEGSTEYMDILNFNDLREAILNSSVGEIVTIKYVRDGEEHISTPVQLIERP